MKKISLLLICFIVSHFSFAQSNPESTIQQIIIKFKEDKKPETVVLPAQGFEDPVLHLLNKDNGIQSIRLTGNKKNADTYVLVLNTNKSLKDLVALYQNTGLFDYVEPDFLGEGHGFETIPDDTEFGQQWSHLNDGSFALSNATVDADIDSELAWDITVGDPNLVVAILDSGTKLDHPELAARIWNNPNEANNGVDSDLNTFVDDVNGWDFANDDNDPTDDHGHGTNVTGIALAAGDNGLGYAGMNWNSKIMVCKILDEDNVGFYSWWADAIYYAVDNGASVINLSAGGNSASFLLENAVNYAYSNNVPVVVSTGNGNTSIQYPARYHNAFAIGSTNSDDTRSVPFFWNSNTGSNYGPELDFVAPGNYIYGLRYNSNTNYNSYWGGTSQAAPLVSGLLSLLLSVDPTLSVDEMRTILEETSEDQVGSFEDTEGWDPFYGHGRINAFQALSSVAMAVSTTEEVTQNTLIYPNPIATGAPLEISNLVAGKYTVTIYNVGGQQIYKEIIATDHSSITLIVPKLATGTYLFKIADKSGNKIALEKIVVE